MANVPIILNEELPSALFELSPGRLFGLTIDPGRLVEFRRVRDQRWGGALGDYADPGFVQLDVAYAKNIFHSRSEWPVIEVTDKPIEGIMSEILALVEEGQEQTRG